MDFEKVQKAVKMAETEMKSNAQRKKESIKEVTLMMEEFVQNAARRGEVYPSEKAGMEEKLQWLKNRFHTVLKDINCISAQTENNLRSALEFEVFQVIDEAQKNGVLVDLDVKEFVEGLWPKVDEKEIQEEDTVTWIKRAAKTINRGQPESSKKPVSFVDYIGMELGGEVRGISLKQLELQEQEAIKEDLRRENERKREEIRRKVEQQKKEDDERFIKERNQEVRKMMREKGRDFNFTAEVLDEFIEIAEQTVKKRWDDEMDQQFSAAEETQEEQPAQAEEEETLVEEEDFAEEDDWTAEEDEETEGEDSDSSYEFLSSVVIPVSSNIDGPPKMEQLYDFECQYR
ncbi:Oidioi.mRNA.OKI2018_I69.chr1.g3684.t1.cds [Oikopleura dioica]|uniref:Oidioi.mRNA.OKI2018_I69.chr1.g3684.t1.cds n=1 Tax=Oikopleura dioica TaxID=34765 RepID=A0ABN7SYW7_OIKDI|nr:Oidioi.mRNA.OKI2018_I69.chr1.g3684.t1.cds [Oikopleura dioica]